VAHEISLDNTGAKIAPAIGHTPNIRTNLVCKDVKNASHKARTSKQDKLPIKRPNEPDAATLKSQSPI